MNDSAFALACLRARLNDIDTTGMTPDQVNAALAALDAKRASNPAWLLGPRNQAGGTVEETAEFIITLARSLEATSDNPVNAALYDVLANASTHLPAFAERADGSRADEPWGCVICGTADGTGACDTWLSGLGLAKALRDRG